MSTPTFATTHNLVAFLEKSVESEGFDQIIDVLNANPIKYALTVQKINDQEHIQALVDKKKIIINEDSIRRDLKLDDAEGSTCLPNATIFEELARMGYEKPSQRLTFYKAYFSPQWKFLIHTILQCLSVKTTAWNEFNSTMASFIICLANNQKFNYSKYILDHLVNHLEGDVKYYLFPRFVQLFLNKQVAGLNKHKDSFVVSSHTKKFFANMRRQSDGFSGDVTPLFDVMMVQAIEDVGEDSDHSADQTPIHDQPLTSSNTQKKLKPRRKQRKETEEPVSTSSSDPLSSGEDSFLLNELMVFYLSLQEQLLDLQDAKAAQAKEIATLKKKIKKLERKRSLGNQEDSSKQGRMIEALDADNEVTLKDNVDLMFDTSVFEGDEVVANIDEVIAEPEVVTTVSGPTTTTNELTLAQTLIEIAKSKKVEAITTAATSVTNVAVTSPPKAKGIIFHDPEEQRSSSKPTFSSTKLTSKDKGKAIMIEPEKPLKKKDQVVADEEYARQVAAEMLIDCFVKDFKQERENLSIEDKSKLFVELMNKRKKHFAELRAKEMRNKPPTKTQRRNQMSTYLKHMGTYKHSQLKNKNYEEIERLFEKEMKRVNTFIPMDQDEESSKKDKSESKRVGVELESDVSKRQKLDEQVESDKHEKVEQDDEAKVKRYLQIVREEDIPIDAIPLASKPPMIIEYKIIKEGIFGHFQLIRADGSSKRYSSMIKMIQSIDREDLEALWKLVKTKHGNTRSKDEFERVLLVDLKVMFEPDIISEVWRSLQGYTVVGWKLFDSYGVHHVRFSTAVHIFMMHPPYKFKWAYRTILVAEGSSETTTEGYMENYKNVSEDIRNLFNAEAEDGHIILTGIDNDIYSTVDACPNAMEMWKAIERLKQGESINVQDLETNLYWEFKKFTLRDGESLESYYSRFYKMINELVKNKCEVTNHQVNVQFLLQLQPEWQRFVTLVKQSQELKTVSYHKLYDILKQHQNEVNEIRAEILARTANPLALVPQQQPVYHPQSNPTHYTQNSSTRSQQAATKNRGKAIVNFSPSIYDQEPDMVTEDDALTSSNTNRANQDNTPRINRGTRYDNQRAVNVVGARDNVGECQKPKRAKDAAYYKEKMILYQELEAHYLYMAKIQEVSPDVADNSGPIFDAEPLQKVQHDDDYNVFANDRQHLEKSESVNDTYPDEQGDNKIIIDSLDMSTNGDQVDHDDDDLARERNLLASLIEKLKCEIDDNKNHNKFLESSNQTLVDKLKSEIECFKNKNKCLESSNNHFKEANTELVKNNQLMFKDLKKFQAELDRYHDVNYASKVEIECAKAKGELVSHKMSSEKSFNEYTRKINDFNQTISKMKKELIAHQESISIMSQEKEAQKKFYKTREDKELEKVIALENKIKVLDDIVYKPVNQFKQ
ncbi:hypothetical protein Tco_1354840 [Tanacetum coccineum]